MKIPIARPLFGQEEIDAVAGPLTSGWVVQGPKVAEFERKFASYVGAPHAVAASNGTTALHLGVAALGLQPGDEVVVPAFTWVATANAVEYQGAKAVFCDIDLDTFNSGAREIESRITEKTVGIIPVHLFGLCADIDPILALARELGLWVLEDAACAFGASVGGRQAGTFGDAAAFSFHPRKSITTGEGGMVTTASERVAQAVRSMRDHGASAASPSGAPFLMADFDVLGYNYRMTDLQAAVGCVQMDRADFILAERRRRAAIYDEQLRDLRWLVTPRVPAGHVHGYQAYVCRFEPVPLSLATIDDVERRRNAVMASLQERGIATRPGTHAAALVGYYRRRYGLTPADFPNAHMAERATITLPLYPQMTDSEQDEVVDALRRARP